MTSSQKYELCLSIYRDVVNGYSTCVDGSDEIYIKHLKDIDQSFFQHKKEYFRNIAVERGLLTQEKHIEVLKDTQA